MEEAASSLSAPGGTSWMDELMNCHNTYLMDRDGGAGGEELSIADAYRTLHHYLVLPGLYATELYETVRLFLS